MASFTPLTCNAVLRLNAGTDPSTGKTILRQITLSGLLPSATADNLAALTSALTPLLAHPVLETRRVETDGVTP
jgi:hypothetical protein